MQRGQIRHFVNRYDSGRTNRGLGALVSTLRGRPLSVSRLEGGLTNFNCRIDVEGESCVLRIASEDSALLGIDRGCEVVLRTKLTAKRIGVRL